MNDVIVGRIIAAALVVIAVNLSVNTLSQFPEEEVVVPEKTEMVVLPVVGKASTDYDMLGAGSTGFVVQDGAKLNYVRVDEGSRLGMMDMPKMLLRLTVGEKEYIQPLFPNPLIMW